MTAPNVNAKDRGIIVNMLQSNGESAITMDFGRFYFHKQDGKLTYNKTHETTGPIVTDVPVFQTHC